MSELPQKEYFKLSEVCQFTDTQPYVLRFWESEFPQLNPERSSAGQPRYRKADIELVQRIKKLLYDEDFTLDSAREQLSQETSGKGKRKADSAPQPANAVDALKQSAGTTDEPRPSSPPPQSKNRNGDSSSGSDVVSRRRYEDAVDEIDHLRMALKDAEKKLRRAESDLEQTMAASERDRRRADRALAHLETLRRLLAGQTS